jgi:XTP/dITP diphosphohydrolase
MLELIFASGNAHKVKEISQILSGYAVIKGLNDLGIDYEIPETGSTLEENALIKAEYLSGLLGCNCFADDSGLEVEALGGAPGVRSARYAGEQKNDNENLRLLLKNLEGELNRKAAFRTVIALVIEEEKFLFEGRIEGVIVSAPSGNSGFGYDPVFRPDGHQHTFAEMTFEEKNKISHRAIAVQKLKKFLVRRQGIVE